jgi:hypothetical protein
LIEFPHDYFEWDFVPIWSRIKDSRTRRYQPEEVAEFFAIVKDVEQNQELKLASGGLSNVFNANITKLLLSKHGYSDRQEVDHTSGGEKISELKITMV